MHYKNLYLIGTSHIAVQSINEVGDSILNIKPKIIALELDFIRLRSLLSAKKPKLKFRDVRRFGIKGFLFNIIGAYIEKKLGKLVGIKPGTEMKTAIRLAKENNIEVALIDQDITLTLKNLSDKLTAKEKLRFISDIIKGIFFKKVIKINLKEVPSKDIIKKLTNQVKKRYPSIYKTLIEDRDLYMAKALYKIMNSYPNSTVIAIVGAGHVDGIIKNIKKFEYES